jgi:predicted phosphohydrolase
MRIFFERSPTVSVFVMGDLHLSTNHSTNKSMEKFGKRWLGYTEKIRKNWEAVVAPKDTVVIPGDISWAMKLEEALSDFRFIESLPGTKLIGKGNHDFWWSTGAKMNAFFEENHISSVKILNNNAYMVEDQVLCGTRGWFLDERQQVTVGAVDYEKIINREVTRLKISLDAGKKLQDECGLPMLVFLHFPPVWNDCICREIVDTLKAYDIKTCYFGHIHGSYSAPRRFEFEGIEMVITSADFLNFAAMPIFA